MINVGVLMAVYHGDDPVLLDRSIFSILNQKLTLPVNVRIYLGVDGPVSVDIKNIIDMHSNNIFKIYYGEINRGLAYTLNSLIELREDELYYFRMDADDYSCCNRLQSQIEFLNSNPDIDILGSDIIEVNLSSGNRRLVKYPYSSDAAFSNICKRVPVAHPTVCFRRKVFDVVSHYPLFNGNEDIAMWFICLHNGLKFGNVPMPLLEFSVNDKLFARRGLQKCFGEFKCYVDGIEKIWGKFNWRLIYPVLRLTFRLMPVSVVKFGYYLRASKVG